MSAIKPAVRDVFLGFTARYEAVIYHLYADIKNLVTTGAGNLVDPVERALSLPLRTPDGEIASEEAIRADWEAVKNDPGSAQGGAPYARTITGLRMTQDDVRQLVDTKLDQVGDALAVRFPGFEDFPADAQLALLSWAWAVGTGAKFPALDEAVAARDWDRAADEIQINASGNPGVVPRNAVNRDLMHAAAGVLYPDQLSLSVGDDSALPEVPPPGENAPVLSALQVRTTSGTGWTVAKVLAGLVLLGGAAYGTKRLVDRHLAKKAA